MKVGADVLAAPEFFQVFRFTPVHHHNQNPPRLWRPGFTDHPPTAVRLHVPPARASISGVISHFPDQFLLLSFEPFDGGEDEEFFSTDEDCDQRR